MWSLLRFIKPYWPASAIAPLCMILEVYMDVLQPKYMARIVDRGVLQLNLGEILHTGGVMAGIAMVGLLAGVGCNVFASQVSQSFGADIREALFAKVQLFSFRNLDRFQTGSLITRMTNDVTQVQNLVQMAQQMLIRAPGLAIGSIVMALTLSLKLGLILLISVPILALFLYLLIRVSYPIFASVQANLDGVNTVVQENLAGIRVVKAFVRARHEIRRFRKANEAYTAIAVKAARVMALNMPVMNLILNMSIVAVLWIGGHAVWNGAMPLGNLIAFVNYVTQILSSLMMVGMILVNVSQAKVSADRIRAVLQTEPDIADKDVTQGLPARGGRVEFDRVSFSYGTDAVSELVLRDVSFRAEPGRKVAIIGSTGSGKSSLVNLIARLYDPTRGVVRIDGIDARELELAELRSRIGMVLQESILFSGSIWENIAFGRTDASPQAIEEAAKAAQAHGFIVGLPEGYETRVGQRGVNLSGGQKQRIAIARAILIQPVILILDDSTSALDLNTEARLQIALRRVMNEATTFLIAQRISSVLDFEQILVLDDGRLVGQGTHAELLANCGVYRDIYESQMGKGELRHA